MGSKKEAPVTGYSIATRNTAESKWKADIKKMQRQENQMKDYLTQIEDIRSKGVKNISKQETKLIAMEDEYILQLEEVTEQLEELMSLSKEDAVGYYATEAASNDPKRKRKGSRT